MKRHGLQPPLRSGFTQGDLLLALAGVALLLALVVPMVSRSRENSRLAQCVQNLGKVNGAMLSYVQEHGGRLPKAKTTPAPGGWWSYKNDLVKYLPAKAAAGDSGSPWACPSDRGYAHTEEIDLPFAKSAKYHFTSYVYNGVTLPGLPNVSGREVSGIRDPEKTLTVMEWTAHGPLSWHRSRTGRGDSPFYDGAESVAGFVDGHVRLTRFHFDGINAAYTRDPAPGYDYKYGGD